MLLILHLESSNYDASQSVNHSPIRGITGRGIFSHGVRIGVVRVALRPRVWQIPSSKLDPQAVAMLDDNKVIKGSEHSLVLHSQHNRPVSLARN
jgi:hypothetical protein